MAATAHHLKELSVSKRSHVVPGETGNWKVVAPGASPSSSRHGTQAEAEQRAKQILRGVGGGEAVIHRPPARSATPTPSGRLATRTHPPTRSTEAPKALEVAR